MGELSLRDVVRQVCLELALPAVKKQIDLSLDAEQEVRMTGHALLLHEMISNLLDNAILYTPVHGTIAIRLEIIHAAPAPDGAATPHALLVIQDSGPGIALGDREKVFHPFYRAASASAGNPGGTGLGLSIVRDIVDLHYGQISLADAATTETAVSAGSGLRVELIFPL